MTLRLVMWDVDGTVAETEEAGHRVAFNQAFEAAGLPWRWDVARYGELLKVTGGRERLLRDMQDRPDAPAEHAERDALARRLHAAKNAHYAAIVREGRVPARPGVLRLMDELAAAGVAQAIVTTTSRANVDALFPTLLGARWLERFATVVCAEDAPLKKPHPQAYGLALQRTGVAAAQALAIEDSPNGLEAARAAGVGCVITRSLYFAQARFDAADLMCENLEARPAVSADRLRALLAGRGLST
jgi:HAD superfamily hydrolase (TIGR01509 family)